MVDFPPGFPFVRRETTLPSERGESKPDNAKPIGMPAQSSSPAASIAVEPAIPPAAKPLVERRKYPRDRMAAQALIHVDGEKRPPTRVSLVDITIAGVRFAAPRSIDVGDKLQIRLEVGPFRWTTRMRVIHSTRSDPQTNLIGCAFLRTELLRPWPAAA